MRTKRIRPERLRLNHGPLGYLAVEAAHVLDISVGALRGHRRRGRIASVTLWPLTSVFLLRDDLEAFCGGTGALLERLNARLGTSTEVFVVRDLSEFLGLTRHSIRVLCAATGPRSLGARQPDLDLDGMLPWSVSAGRLISYLKTNHVAATR